MLKPNTPLLSVIVPVYNTEPYLQRCLDSIIRQTYTNLEIILVDDGSTDGSGRICEEYAEKDGRIKVLHKTNGGLVSARKAGLQVAAGEYATYVDSDDFIEQGMYECYMHLALETDADVVTGGKIRDYGSHVVPESESAVPGVYKGRNLERLREMLIDAKHFFKYNVSVHIYDKIYRTPLLKKYQMQVPDKIIIGEDAAVVYPLLFDAKSIYITGKNYYHYCIRPDSMMGLPSSGKMDSSCLMLDYIHGKILGYGENTVFRNQFRLFDIYIRLLRSPMDMLRYENELLWPFGKINKNESVIVYGAGKFGTVLRTWLLNEGFNVVAWVDSSENRQETLSWDIARKILHDKILVATLIYETTESIVKRLVEDGVKREKILSVNIDAKYIKTGMGGV